MTNPQKRLSARHGIVASYPSDFFGYFGWPTVARTGEGMLGVAASGLRNGHICPFGRTVFCASLDDGATWTPPAVINDFPIDDRDAGVCCPGGDRIVVSWFSSDTRISLPPGRMDVWKDRGIDDPQLRDIYTAGLMRITDRTAKRRAGNWIRTSPDRGESWGEPVRVSVTAPHGPIVLNDGRLFFFGKGHLGELGNTTQLDAGIGAIVSDDRGGNWTPLGTVPLLDGTDATNYYEPHAVQLGEGRFLGLIRVQDGIEKGRLEKIGITNFSMAQTLSDDGGITWSKTRMLNFHGSPPHIFRHSTGILVCVYGYRLKPFGQRAMFSRDEGDTWEYDWIIRDDGPDIDLGYPSSVELPDGSIFTVYYQKLDSPDEKPGLLWSRWRLPRDQALYSSR